MASEVEDIGKEFAKCVIVDTLKELYTYIRNYNTNIKRLQEKYNDLNNLKKTILSQVDRGNENLRKSTKLTDGWLAKVNALVVEDEVLKRLVDKEYRKGKEQSCFGRLHCNLYQRYKMSKIAEDKAKEIESVFTNKPEESMITEPISVSDLKSIPTEFLTSLRSRVELMEKILKKLQDDRVDVVGIFGMGAIGKTTLAKEIANNNEVKNKFNKTVMVEISEAPNVERIQHQIADQIGLNLFNEHSTEQRAIKLYNGLIMSGKNILVILDNIWQKLDLGKVGIPQHSEKSRENGCKILVTSREKGVCRLMGIEQRNIFEVCPLDQYEAKLLFTARVGKMVGKEYEEVETRMLNKCGGLPLSIVALADVLKDQELSMWEHYASELEKPTSIHGTIRGVNRLTYSILETSYKLIESEEKRKFFLLASLFPLGSYISVGDMMRYGIGMELFQDVNNLAEAMEQANTWANELKSSSLLLEHDRSSWLKQDYLGSVKIHDVVRASTMSLAKKDGHLFMVEAFPRWRNMNTCQKYTAISLMAGTDHSRLRGLKSDKLEILILDCTQPREFDESFCQHMTNLKVLVLKGMEKCEYRLQNSIQGLKSSLRTLHLEGCRLGDIGGIGMLIFLEVLSLRKSSVEELPAEAMRNLCNLRLLDLTRCKIGTQGIPADVLGMLSQLEGLYAYHSLIRWATDHSSRGSTSTEHAGDEEMDTIQYKHASVDELNKLRYLNALEMAVLLKELPNDDTQFVNNLDQFYVRIISDNMMKDDMIIVQSTEWCRYLEVVGLNIRLVMENKSVKSLLKKTESLHLDEIVGLEDHYLGRFEFGSVRELTIEFLSLDNKHAESGIINWSAFPNLESLNLLLIDNMRKIVGHQQPQVEEVTTTGGRRSQNDRMFPPKLHHLQLQCLNELEHNVVPIDLLPPNLTTLVVRVCPKLKYIFGKAEADNKTNAPNQLPPLKTLDLEGLNILESMVEVPNSSTASSISFFNSQLIFGALEEVELYRLSSIVTMWDMMPYSKQIDVSSYYSNLKKLSIRHCPKLETVCPLSIAAALVHLNKLSIKICSNMREAIRDEDCGVSSSTGGTQQHALSIFPSLESLYLGVCPKMERFISSSAKQSNNNNNILPRVIEFRSLQTLYIDDCDEMRSFFAEGSLSFPKLTDFTYNNVQQSMGGDINHFLETSYQQRLSENN